jgi:hypothetical protein
VQATAAEKQLRTLRIVYSGIWASAITYPFVAERLAPPGTIDTTIYASVSVVAVGMAVAAVLVRKTMLGKAERRSELSQRESAMRLWLVGHIVPFCMAEAVVLFGLVIRFLGATFKQALPLYALGIAVLLMNAPQRFEVPEN